MRPLAFLIGTFATLAVTGCTTINNHAQVASGEPAVASSCGTAPCIASPQTAPAVTKCPSGATCDPSISMRPAFRPTEGCPTGNLCGLTAGLNLLAEQLDANLKHKSAYPAILSATFVNLNHLDDTSPLGRVVTEGLVARLQVRGWNLYDVRLSKAVAVTPEGEFVLSRDPKRLEYQYATSAVLAGTYSITGNEVLIHARVIDVSTGVVVSAGELRLPIDSEVARLLVDSDQLRPMRIIRP